MSEVKTISKALVTQPLKTSQPTGATLAAMGFDATIPLLHGSQGCSAFAKVYLIQHLREPIPLQNTAVDQVAAVMGADDNLVQALYNLANKQHPQCIAVFTTGLTEMQGSDIHRTVKLFQQQYPQFLDIEIVPVATPDFKGSMESGFAKFVDAMVRQCAQPYPITKQTNLVNVLCSVAITAADLDLLRRYLDAFDLEAIFLPDLAESVDGHLEQADFSATSTGGTSVEQVRRVSSASMTLVVGESMYSTAKWLKQQFGIPFVCCGLGMGIQATDHLLDALAHLSGKSVPLCFDRERKRLQDAMLDTHFLLSGAKVAIAAEPDLAQGYIQLLQEIGAELPLVVTTAPAKLFQGYALSNVLVGDLSLVAEQLEHFDVVVGNSHCAQICEPQVPVIRAGFPCYDHFGNMDILQIGYEGARSRLYAFANALLRNHHNEVTAHISQYAFSAEQVTPNHTFKTQFVEAL